MNFIKNHTIAFSLSVFFHLVVIGLLMLAPTSVKPVRPKVASHEPQMPHNVHALTIDEHAVQDEVRRIERQERAKHQREVAAARKLKQTRAAEAAAKARLAKINAQKASEAKRIANLKQEADKLAKAHQAAMVAKRKELAALEAKRQQARAKALADQKRREAAKRAEQKRRKQAELALAKAEQAKRLAQAKAERDAQVKSEISKYAGLIRQAIESQWIKPEAVNTSQLCKLMISLSKDGSVLEAKLVESSGVAILDRSARAAVFKASPLPVPKSADVFKEFARFTITIDPNHAMG